MKQYHDLLQHVLDHGHDKSDRTGTGTRSVFGHQTRYDLSQGFPLITTKKLHWKSIVIELLWLLRGETTLKFLHQYGVSIWDEWADENGNLGPVYGEQWRKWKTGNSYKLGVDSDCYIDQIDQVISQIKSNPDSRRLIVSAWNVADISKMKLPPCHTLFQFYVVDGKLSCLLYQRSADSFLGVPFNIASYALLTHLIAYECGLQVGEFIHSFGDLHIYNNHFSQVAEQLSREEFPLPKIRIDLGGQSLLDFVADAHNYTWQRGEVGGPGLVDRITLLDYLSHPPIKAEVSV